MPTKILLDNSQTATGRPLVQGGHSIAVLSECCGKKISMDNDWHFCLACDKKLEEVTRGWLSEIHFADVRVNGWASGWGAWLRFWFGLEDAEMSFNDGT